jgi:hypothetical protein
MSLLQTRWRVISSEITIHPDDLMPDQHTLMRPISNYTIIMEFTASPSEFCTTGEEFLDLSGMTEAAAIVDRHILAYRLNTLEDSAKEALRKLLASIPM